MPGTGQSQMRLHCSAGMFLVSVCSDQSGCGYERRSTPGQLTISTETFGLPDRRPHTA